MIFRLQNNVPEVYVDKSMDFQLFTRIFDLAFNSTKYSVDTLKESTNTLNCDDSLLPLLGYKLGFFENNDLTPKQQRLLLSAFPKIIRNKGTFQALKDVVHLFSRLNNSDGQVQYAGNYSFQVVFYPEIKNTDLLMALLKYILPTGYDIEYIAANTTQSKDEIYIKNTVTAKLFDSRYYPRFSEDSSDALNNNAYDDEDLGDLRKTSFYTEPDQGGNT